MTEAITIKELIKHLQECYKPNEKVAYMIFSQGDLEDAKETTLDDIQAIIDNSIISEINEIIK